MNWKFHRTRLSLCFLMPYLYNSTTRTEITIDFWCHHVFTLSEMLCTIALCCCHCVSHGAIFSPSLPVIDPDGCKAALLLNMSRAGEEEVGVESGKGQRPKKSPYTSSCPHMLWHSSHAAWTLEQVVKPPPFKKSKSFLKCICLFLKWGGGGCFWLGDMLLKH